MSHSLGQKSFVKMSMVVFVILVFLGTPSLAAGKILNLVAELSGREEMVEWAGYGEKKLSTVVIGGKLLCHVDRKIVGTSSEPRPVSGALVAVLCGTKRKTNKPLAQGSTNSYGDFLIDLPSDLHAIPNLDKICCVKVVGLPKTTPCQRAFAAGKHKRIKLASVGEGIRTYTTNNIHLMPRN